MEKKLVQKTYQPNLFKNLKVKQNEIQKDVLEQLQVNPLKEYTDVLLLSHFVTTMGHLKSGIANGLSASNQRKVAKAVKRARAFGLLPFTLKPEK
jgi:ribosomal protein S18